MKIVLKKNVVKKV